MQRRGLVWASVMFLSSVLGPLGLGQGPTVDEVTIEELIDRLDTQAAEIEALRSRLESQDKLYGSVISKSNGDCGPQMRRLPVVADDCWQPTCGKSGDPPKFHTLRFYADYDGGLVVRPYCPEKYPYELRVNLWTQFRHHGFARDVVSWTDNAGVTRTVRNRNAFDIERARLVFSGYALDERLTYFVHMDADSDGGHIVDFFDHWWAWGFSDQFQLQLGKRKVTASRQWLLGARRTRFSDRPMACDFFRPDRTVGLFGVGTLGESSHYEIMVGNGYSDGNVPNSRGDQQFTFAATHSFEPLGKFGGQIVDYEYHCDPLVQFGHSFVYSPNAATTLGTPLDDTSFLRLTDGTLLTQAGALAPGVTVSNFDVYLYAVDAAWKWQGWSVNAEAYFRWINDIRGNAAVPITKLYQRGFFVEGGRFLIPEKLDGNVRYSQVQGQFGDSHEYAVGLNWYPLESHKMKISFDVTELDGSPLNNTTSDILVGDDGTLFRTQFQAEF